VRWKWVHLKNLHSWWKFGKVLTKKIILHSFFRHGVGLVVLQVFCSNTPATSSRVRANRSRALAGSPVRVQFWERAILNSRFSADRKHHQFCWSYDSTSNSTKKVHIDKKLETEQDNRQATLVRSTAVHAGTCVWVLKLELSSKDVPSQLFLDYKFFAQFTPRRPSRLATVNPFQQLRNMVIPIENLGRSCELMHWKRSEAHRATSWYVGTPARIALQ